MAILAPRVNAWERKTRALMTMTGQRERCRRRPQEFVAALVRVRYAWSNSMTGRTSTEPYSASGIWDAISTASSRLSHRTI